MLEDQIENFQKIYYSKNSLQWYKRGW